jgi:hypothetical protein
MDKDSQRENDAGLCPSVQQTRADRNISCRVYHSIVSDHAPRLHREVAILGTITLHSAIKLITSLCVSCFNLNLCKNKHILRIKDISSSHMAGPLPKPPFLTDSFPPWYALWLRAHYKFVLFLLFSFCGVSMTNNGKYIQS